MEAIMQGSGAELIPQPRVTEPRSHHCHKMRTFNVVTSSTGGFRGFYHCEYIGHTLVGARALTVDIEELVLRRDE